MRKIYLAQSAIEHLERWRGTTISAAIKSFPDSVCFVRESDNQDKTDLDNLYASCLAVLSEFIPTPEQGYRVEPAILPLDIKRLGQERDELKKIVRGCDAGTLRDQIKILTEENFHLKKEVSRINEAYQRNWERYRNAKDELTRLKREYCNVLDQINTTDINRTLRVNGVSTREPDIDDYKIECDRLRATASRLREEIMSHHDRNKIAVTAIKNAYAPNESFKIRNFNLCRCDDSFSWMTLNQRRREILRKALVELKEIAE